MRKIILLAATGGGSGHAPIAPGTAGSAVGLGLWALLVPFLSVSAAAYLAWTAVAVAIAIWAADAAERIYGTRDDGRITADEIAGQLTALALLPASAGVAIAGFLLFRLFDIWKPWPIRRLEGLPGGWGIVADDVMAGVYANFAGQLLWRVLLPQGLPA